MSGADVLYLTEEQIAERVGVGVDKWRAIAQQLERQGLPSRDPLFCNRRYWPAVRRCLDRWNRMDEELPAPHPAAKENFDEYVTGRAGPKTAPSQRRQ